jgi:hypothetical protein
MAQQPAAPPTPQEVSRKLSIHTAVKPKVRSGEALPRHHFYCKGVFIAEMFLKRFSGIATL